jgi:hypothetical protein
MLSQVSAHHMEISGTKAGPYSAHEFRFLLLSPRCLWVKSMTTFVFLNWRIDIGCSRVGENTLIQSVAVGVEVGFA